VYNLRKLLIVDLLLAILAERVVDEGTVEVERNLSDQLRMVDDRLEVFWTR
jgi:hypothetical protein